MTAQVHKLFRASPTPVQQARPDDQREFDDWYRKYPRKVAKGHARIAFRRARLKASIEELISGVERYCAACAAIEERFIAHPATWLNGERWLDEAPRASGEEDHPARIRAWKTRGLWLDHWGPKPKA